MSDHALHIENLTAGFQTKNSETTILKDISLEVPAGKTVALVGESGSGKSVTSLHSMGLLKSPPSFIRSGKIVVGDKEITRMDEASRRTLRGSAMAMIFQEPMSSLNPVMKCGKQVEEMISVHQQLKGRSLRQRVLDLFAQVELPDPARVYSSYPFEISGGQKQRVMIAMAMSCSPKLLIADEPTTALDVSVQKSILGLMKTLQTEVNAGLLFITHDLGVVAEIADEIVVMKHGEIVETGPASEVLNSPNHPYTKGLIACRPPWNNRPERLPTVSDYLDNPEVNIDLVTKEVRDVRLQKLYSREPILKVNGLSKIYQSRGLFKNSDLVRAVDDVSFEVYKGETLGLVGESGCGKTTLSRTLLRLIEPTSGRIEFNESYITDLGGSDLKDMRRKMQIIFQDPYSSLNPRKTIGEAITEPMIVHKVEGSAKARKLRALSLLEKVGLDESHYDRYPHEFSGGQRQRIAIARTLAVEPEFVICDESVSALDVSVQAQVLNLLNDLKEEFNLTYIFISHDLSVVRYMSDRIMVMKDGRIEEIGEADQVCESPESEYTRKIIDSIPGI